MSTTPTLPIDFPGGLADAEGRWAAVNDRAGRLIAVALDTGTELWRSDEPLRPLLVRADEVLALRLAEAPQCVAMRLRGSTTGRESWTSAALPLPEWVAAAGTLSGDLDTWAAWRDDAIELQWQARRRYRGGAAPGPKVEARSRADAVGQMRIDRASGAVTTAQPHVAAPTAPATSAPHDPRAVAQCEIGARRYALIADTAPDGIVRSVLRASACVDGRVLWELVLDEAPRSRPRPLRA